MIADPFFYRKSLSWAAFSDLICWITSWGYPIHSQPLSFWTAFLEAIGIVIGSFIFVTGINVLSHDGQLAGLLFIVYFVLSVWGSWKLFKKARSWREQKGAVELLVPRARGLAMGYAFTWMVIIFSTLAGLACLAYRGAHPRAF